MSVPLFLSPNLKYSAKGIMCFVEKIDTYHLNLMFRTLNPTVNIVTASTLLRNIAKELLIGRVARLKLLSVKN